MLLRRVIEHVKHQNWTAVALDFVIVVMGVFIGIQVSNWNEARADHEEGRQLLTRLYEETGSLLEIQRAEYAAQSPRAELMSPINALLFDQSPESALTDVECRLIAISHWLPAPTDELPVLDEAVSTGGGDLISNGNVKENLRAFALVRDRSRRQYAEATNELFRLSSRHPDAVWYTRTPLGENDEAALSAFHKLLQSERRAGEGYRWANGCDLDAMRRNNAFLADYVDNRSRLISYIERYEELIAVLSKLYAALADELGEAQSAATAENSQ